MLLGLIRPTAGDHDLLGVSRCPPAGRRGAAPGGLPCRGSGVSPVPVRAGRTCARLDAADRTADPSTATARISTALERVGLLAAAGKRYRAYSLGMRQRLALAAALLSPRDLLILDEPTNGLDPQGTREVRSLITGLAADGTTVMLSTHLLSEVEQICDHVGVMHRGAPGRAGSARATARRRRTGRPARDRPTRAGGRGCSPISAWTPGHPAGPGRRRRGHGGLGAPPRRPWHRRRWWRHWCTPASGCAASPSRRARSGGAVRLAHRRGFRCRAVDVTEGPTRSRVDPVPPLGAVPDLRPAAQLGRPRGSGRVPVIIAIAVRGGGRSGDGGPGGGPDFFASITEQRGVRGLRRARRRTRPLPTDRGVGDLGRLGRRRGAQRHAALPARGAGRPHPAARGQVRRRGDLRLRGHAAGRGRGHRHRAGAVRRRAGHAALGQPGPVGRRPAAAARGLRLPRAWGWPHSARWACSSRR